VTAVETPISRPLLPPKKGYVEVEIDGKRTYRNADTGILIDDEVPTPTMDERVTELEDENAMLKAQINAQSEQIDFYEDCIVEMAAVVYA
jgi:hypothetical protein